ncbi:MAG TPA: LapA family protein [Anaerovoracaceae bacterium]|nr:LapA family protein [Anaerovoracaceae bacterium]
MQKSQILFITSLIFAIIITIFAITNSEPVTINLIYQEVIASQALVIFISAAIGAVIVSMLGIIKYIKLTMGLKKLKKDNESLKNELEELKALNDNEQMSVTNEADYVIDNTVQKEEDEDILSKEQ